MTEPALNRALLPDNTRVLCALSGGADSVCLLHLLLREGRGLTVAAAHYNHGLRGAESDGDEAFCRALCGEWGVPFFSARGDVAAEAARLHLSVEEAGRRLRYSFLYDTAEAWGADCIATAHNRRDNAETMLINLSRGTGTAGLGGIPPRRGKLVRPLLDAGREEILAYLEANSVPHREDSSNRSDDYTRNRLRHGVLPVLEEIRPGFEGNALRAARLLRADEEFLTSLALEKARELWNGESMDAGGLAALPEPLSARVLRLAAAGELPERHTAPPDDAPAADTPPALRERDVTALLSLCRSGGPSGELCLPGRRAALIGGRLFLSVEETPPELAERTLPACGTLELPEAGLAVSIKTLPAGHQIQNSFNTFLFSSAKLCGTLMLTSRREGDRLHLLKQPEERSLKKLFINAGVPRRRRGLVPVLRDDRGPLAVYGFGQAQRAAAAPGEPALCVEFHEMQ